MRSLKLIVGLGNPGPQYERTRHNVGAVWVRNLAQSFGVPLALDAKFKAEVGRGIVLGHDVRLLIPTTFMNLSGEAVGSIARFFKIEADEILVAYDEMAFPAGDVRLRTGGGDNGHNGIKSVRSGLGNDGGFHRLRIGVGHPGDKNKVTAYLTQVKMPVDEETAVAHATDFKDELMMLILTGDWQKAMNILHAPVIEDDQDGDK